MKLLIATLWHKMRSHLLILKFDCILYRWARLLCQWLEEVHPAVSQKAGFSYDLGWLKVLPDETQYEEVQ